MRKTSLIDSCKILSREFRLDYRSKKGIIT